MKQPLLALTLALASTLAQPAPNDYWKFELLHSFGSATGEYPTAGLVEVSPGNFWGTAGSGGKFDQGVVFSYSRAGGVAVVHAFRGKKGRSPAAPLLAAGGLLYGTTELGGLADQGTAFSVSASGAFERLASMDTATTGHQPQAPLTLGPDGRFYGTTWSGGAHGLGTVFRLGEAGATEVVHAFAPLRGGGTQGQFTVSPLVLHPNGDFYGTTMSGGVWGEGSLFRLSPGGAFTLLHSFLPEDAQGCRPQAGLTLAADGSLFGVNSHCGSLRGGTVFRLSPTGTVTLLHTLVPRRLGSWPESGLVRSGNGRLFGTTREGQGPVACGSVFSASEAPGGSVERLHAFAPDGSNGCNPHGTLVVGQDGALYGTTVHGGANGRGTIFRLRHVVDLPPR